MKIEEMFRRDIRREIQGVIIVGQDEEEGIRQELEEYVVTRELQKHFAAFFSAYRKGVTGFTPKMGVWISGFFGSGKSLLLKVFSYLLQNRQVGDKRAMDFFTEDQRISDPALLADMRLAADTPTDVILFNIDSKSETNGKKNKDAIVNVFLKVFNEMQGFCGAIPQLADLERRLSDAGRYQDFRRVFEEKYGEAWEASRQDFDFMQDTVVETLSEIGFMSEAAARNWCEKTAEPYAISIEDFAKRVRAYIEKRGQNHHVVFFVDEIGQYIGEDSRLMLNLQTVTEELGKECRGKAWVVVTSQQDIDSITKVKGNDFSKIQGRFDTRLSLSSANVDAVIKKRILDKTDAAAQTLRLLYEQKATVIRNLILFDGDAEKKLYENAVDFAEVYPFIPYQFNLLASVLTSIRTHGASGKHLSEGERSMLALFKESAMRLGETETGVLAPFHLFYNALENFLDHSHRGVITRAYQNGHINPEGKSEGVFAIDVLKTLFLIKYVLEMPATLDNVTSLMISSLDDDRITLRDRVYDAIQILCGEMLVQRHRNVYVFLTDEEQEINREIEAQNVEMGEVIRKVSELIYDDIFSEKRYRYPAFNGRYTFAYNQSVDDRPYRFSQTCEMGLRVITPWYDDSTEDSVLRMMSGQGQQVIVLLPPNDDAFLSEIRTSLKIENFLRNHAARQLPKYETIKEARRAEMDERAANARLYLADNLKDAVIYVNGDILRTNAKEAGSRINEAVGRLVQTMYHKLSYIEAAMGEAEIRALFRADQQTALNMDAQKPANYYALEDVRRFIADNSKIHLKTSMRTLKERFMRSPYGFVDDDVHWLVAWLFRHGDIDFTVNGAPVFRLEKTEEELVGFITKKQYAEKLLMSEHIRVGDKEKRTVREVMREVFHVSSVSEDEDAIMKNFQHHSEAMIRTLEGLEAQYQRYAYPGKAIVARGKTLLRFVSGISAPLEFYDTVGKRRNDFLDFAEDYEPVEAFFAGEQREIFARTLDMLAIYEDSKTYIVDQTLEEAVESMRAIVRKESPYRDIPKLPELRQRFTDAYMKVLQAEQAPILSSIEQDRKRVLDALSGKEYEKQKRDNYISRFAELSDGAKRCSNVSTLRSYADKANALKLRLLNEMDALDREKAGKGEKTESKSPAQSKKPQKVYMKRMSMKSVMQFYLKTTSWHLESPQDVEDCLAALKEFLLTELEESDIVNIEF